MLAHSQGKFCRVLDFGIDTTVPAVGLSRVPQKMTKATLHIIWCHMLVSCCTNPIQKRFVLVPARTAVKLLLRYSTENQIQPSETTFSNFSDKVVPQREGTKIAGVLPRRAESAPKSPRTNAPTGRVDRNWTKSGGKAP